MRVLEICHETVLPAAPEQIWESIGSVEKFNEWNSLIGLEGTFDLAAKVEYRFRFTPQTWQWRLEGTVAELRDPQLIAFRAVLGWRKLFTIEDSYRLTKQGSSTLLEHRIRCSGFIISIANKNFRSNLHSMMRRADGMLEAHVNRKSRTTSAPNSRKRGFRQPKRKRRPN